MVEMNDLETFSNFAWRMGVTVNTASRKIRDPRCPQNFEVQEGATGRISALRASAELEEFIRSDPRVKRNKKLCGAM